MRPKPLRESETLWRSQGFTLGGWWKRQVGRVLQ